MLNIGRLGSDVDAIVDYYTAEVEDIDPSVPSTQADKAQSSSERYYLRDDAQGRWVGSLREQLGIDGGVQAEAFRNLLQGLHPISAEPLTPGAQKAQRMQLSRRRKPAKHGVEMMSVTQVAERLDMSSRHVRRLLDVGNILDDEDITQTWKYLRGIKSAVNVTGPGRARWQIAASEVERYERARQASSMRPGFDLTLRPPKSVSILWALGRPEWSNIVADAHRQAVDQVISYYEDSAVYSRKRVDGEQLRIATEGLIGAAFDHKTSRAGDPLLHSHVVTFNVTKCADGEWRSLDGTPIYEHAKTAGYLYQAHLRHVLGKQLGVQWTEVTNGTAEIVGIPKEIIDLFSKRRDEIESAVADYGFHSAKAHQAATLDTRRPKGDEPEPPALLSKWWGEARALGFSEEVLTACLSLGAEEGHLSFVETLPDVFELLMSEKGLTQMMSTFAPRDVLRELSERAVAECSGTELRGLVDRFFAEVEAIQLNTNDKVLTPDELTSIPALATYSTPELMGKEAQVLDWASKAFDGTGAVARIEHVEAALGRYSELSDEQVAMVRKVTRSGARLHLVAGDPGSGKTYGMRVAVEALVASGVPVIGAALSADAGAELEESIDLMGHTGRDAGTIARLVRELGDNEAGGFNPGTVLVLDEASMIGTRMLHTLIEHLDKADGTLVLLGDPNQHGSVEAGGVYRHLVNVQSKNVISLHANNRQTDEVEREAIKLFRDEKIRESFDLYDGAGKIVRSETLEQSYDAMVRDWREGWASGDRSPMIAGLNSMRIALNDRARGFLLATGQLGNDQLVVGERDFRVGDWVVARRNKHRLRGINNTYVKNGSIGTVVGMNLDERSITVEFDKEGAICLPDWYLDDGGLDHAYARTTYNVQGKTLGSVGYQPTDVSSFEEGYVALTRAKSETCIYVVERPKVEHTKPNCCEYEHDEGMDCELVAKALEKRRAKLMAFEIDQTVH